MEVGEKMLEELLGRSLREEERKAVKWLCSWEESTAQVFERLFSEVHGAGVIRGLTGRAGEKMSDQAGWFPVNVNEAGKIFWTR